MGERLAPLGAFTKTPAPQANLQARLQVDDSAPTLNQDSDDGTLQRLGEQAAHVREQALHFWQDPMIRKSLLWLCIIALGVVLVVFALVRLMRTLRKRPTLSQFVGLAAPNGSVGGSGASTRVKKQA